MKKTLSIVLIVVLIFGSLPYAFTEQTAGEKLRTLGLVKGDTQGNLLEDEKLSRKQMMVMLARLNGVEDEAENFELLAPFSDVEPDSYYEPFIAYAYSKGWTDGTGDGKFSPDAEVSSQMVATFVLRVLGYEVNWESAITEASVLGIVDDVPGEAFTRKHAFDMIYDAVNTKVSGEDILLGEKLGIGEDISLVSVEAISNTTVVLTFSSDLDGSTVETSNFTITNKYNAEDHLAVQSTRVNGEEVILTVTSMGNLVYEIQVADELSGIYGNPLDSETATTTFAGLEIADAINKMTIKRIDETKIAVAFSENIGLSAEDPKMYSINGYEGTLLNVRKATLEDEEDDAAIIDYKKTVILTIPETKAGQVYTLTVKEGLENIDGVVTTEALSETFVGSGVITKLPKIEEVIALDRQTLKIYFDREVTDETIDGRIWDSSSHTLLKRNILTLKDEAFDLYDNGEAYVYQSKTADNALIVRLDDSVFEKTATKDVFHLLGSAMYIYFDQGANIIAFDSNDTVPTNPFVEGVLMIDQQTIEVYFNEPIGFDGADLNEMKILKASGDLSDNTVVTSVKSITSKDDKVWIMSLEEPITPSDITNDKAFFYIPDGLGKDFTGTVDIMDSDTLETYQSLEFGMNYDDPKTIDNVFAVMMDNRTIEVTYPEEMNKLDVINEENYALLEGESDTDLSELEGIDFKVGYSTYNAATNKATLYLDAPITTIKTTEGYFLAIDGKVENVLGTKTIAKEYTSNLEGLPSQKGLVFQFAQNTDEPTEPKLDSAKVSDDRYSLRIKFNEAIAFADANDAFSLTTDLTSGLTAAEFLNAMRLKVQFENESMPSLVEVSDFSSLSAIDTDDEKEIKVTFNKKLAVDSIGTVTTEEATANKIFNRKSAYTLVDSRASKVSFGVSESLYSDGKVPTLMANQSYGTDSDGDGKLNQVILVYDENMTLTQPIDTNAKAKTLMTALTVFDGAIDKSLVEVMTGVTIEGNKVIIALDDSVVGTGVIKVSIDADTGTFNGQLQDTSILKARDKMMVQLADAVGPVLLSASAEIGSEAVRLSFSEKVSGGSATIPENIEASDLNWQDASGDGASFIKFVLSSKNNSNQAIVVNVDIAVSDIGKDTVNVNANSVFDASGNQASTTAVTLID